MKKISVMVLDDHDIVRLGLESKLKMYPDLEITGSFSRSQEMLLAMRGRVPDVLLMDFTLGNDEVDGLNLIQSIKLRHPSCNILVISATDLPGTINLMLKAGAQGFFSKSQSIDTMALAIRTVAAGRIYLTDTVMNELHILQSNSTTQAGETLLDPFSALSPREREVVRCCLEGMSSKQIAEKFSRSIKTISTQKQSAFQKLGISTDRELFVLSSKLV